VVGCLLPALGPAANQHVREETKNVCFSIRVVRVDGGAVDPGYQRVPNVGEICR
jgi:hypothetical protein